MLEQLNMTTARPAPTPMTKSSRDFSKEQAASESDRKAYEAVVGILQYYKRHRWDWFYAAKELSTRSKHVTQEDMQALN
jgi:hypothetical protein